MMRDNAYNSHHQQVLCRIVAHHAIIIGDEYTHLCPLEGTIYGP